MAMFCRWLATGCRELARQVNDVSWQPRGRAILLMVMRKSGQRVRIYVRLAFICWLCLVVPSVARQQGYTLRVLRYLVCVVLGYGCICFMVLLALYLLCVCGWGVANRESTKGRARQIWFILFPIF